MSAATALASHSWAGAGPEGREGMEWLVEQVRDGPGTIGRPKRRPQRGAWRGPTPPTLQVLHPGLEATEVAGGGRVAVPVLSFGGGARRRRFF